MTDRTDRPMGSERAWTPDVVVVVGGPEDPAGPVGSLPGERLAAARAVPVIAADGGVALARALGLAVTGVVGDLDSATAADLTWARDHGAAVHRHHPDKDETDLELALALAAEAVPAGRLLVLGSGSGRLDHLLGDLLLLGGPATARWSVRGHLGPAEMAVARRGDPVDLVGSPRQHVSLFALTGPVTGITTSGLRWPLLDGVLDPTAGSLRSNELIGTRARIEVGAGDLVVIRPGTLADPFPDRDAP